MFKKESMITRKTVPSDAIIGTADKDIIKGKTQRESVMNTTGGSKPVRVNRALRVSSI